MSIYVVRFMKDVLGEYGRQSEVCQGALEIDAADEAEARERAKAKFCKDQWCSAWSSQNLAFARSLASFSSEASISSVPWHTSICRPYWPSTSFMNLTT